MNSKKPGEGSITPLRNGRFWVRSPGTGTDRRGLGTYATREEAEAILDAARALQGVGSDKLTFAKFGASVLDLREADGLRSVPHERARFRLHLADSTIAHLPLADVKPRHIAELGRTLARTRAADKREARKISRATVQRCLALVSAVFSEALQRGLVEANPCVGIKVKKDAAVTAEPWTFLTLDEQHAIRTCEEIPIERRLAIRFAIGTGLRQGEQWHLELSDVHVEGDAHVIVRFGSKGKAPKSGKIRRVPLFGDALEAAREWLAVLPAWCPTNPEGLMFPTQRGCRRGKGKPFGRWDALAVELAKVGITRTVRWHDFRHTACSSLVAGVWGRRWSLEEICALAGHSSIVVTQRYAHLADTALKIAARETGYAGVTGGTGAGCSLAAIVNDSNAVGRVGLEPTTYGLKGQTQGESSRQLATEGPPSGSLVVTSLASAFLDLVTAGKLDQALAVGLALANAQIATTSPGKGSTVAIDQSSSAGRPSGTSG